MSTMAGIGNGLQAALLLARGRADGMALLTSRDETARATAVRSFWAAALCFPAFICLQLADMGRLPPTVNAAHCFALQLTGYPIAWAGYALLSRGLAVRLGRGDGWLRFIAAWNWCNVVQALLLVVASLPSLLGFPELIADTAWVAAYGWSLWLEWYATKLALRVSGLQAIGFVALDEAVAYALAYVILCSSGVAG